MTRAGPLSEQDLLRVDGIRTRPSLDTRHPANDVSQCCHPRESRFASRRGGGGPGLTVLSTIPAFAGMTIVDDCHPRRDRLSAGKTARDQGTPRALRVALYPLRGTRRGAGRQGRIPEGRWPAPCLDESRSGERGAHRPLWGDARRVVNVRRPMERNFSLMQRGNVRRGGAGLYASARGRTTVKVVPCPSCESTQMRPWWLSTIDLTMDNPRPVPPLSSGTLLPR